MDERALAELHDLRSRDDELTSRRERLRELDSAVADLRSRAEAIDAFFVVYPDEEARRRGQLDDARAQLERRVAERAEAARELEQARDEEARELARRAVARADDHVATATGRVEEAERARAELEQEAAELPHELPELEARAASVAAEAGLAAPGRGPRELTEWASHARAELFVTAGQVDAQRDRIVREANELASMLIGEPTYGSTVAQALGRVERA
jgi:chromosome segregation ATPase